MSGYINIQSSDIQNDILSVSTVTESGNKYVLATSQTEIRPDAIHIYKTGVVTSYEFIEQDTKLAQLFNTGEVKSYEFVEY